VNASKQAKEHQGTDKYEYRRMTAGNLYSKKSPIFKYKAEFKAYLKLIETQTPALKSSLHRNLRKLLYYGITPISFGYPKNPDP